MLLGYHAPQAFNWGRGWSHAGFGIKSPSAATVLVFEPVTRRNVLIGPGHFHSAHAGELRDLACGGGKIWIRPTTAVQHPDVHFFDRTRRREIAAVEPHQQGGMASQSLH